MCSFSPISIATTLLQDIFIFLAHSSHFQTGYTMVTLHTFFHFLQGISTAWSLRILTNFCAEVYFCLSSGSEAEDLETFMNEVIQEAGLLPFDCSQLLEMLSSALW
jgi:hypothetical protein